MPVAEQQFDIPQVVLEKYPELVEMLKNSESIDHEEKQYWFSALETMDDDQIESLKGILDDEQEQLQQVEEEFTEGAEEAFNDAEKELLEKQRREAIEKRKQEEMAARDADEDRQEELLSMLDDL